MVYRTFHDFILLSLFPLIFAHFFPRIAHNNERSISDSIEFDTASQSGTWDEGAKYH